MLHKLHTKKKKKEIEKRASKSGFVFSWQYRLTKNMVILSTELTPTVAEVQLLREIAQS